MDTGALLEEGTLGNALEISCNGLVSLVRSIEANLVSQSSMEDGSTTTTETAFLLRRSLEGLDPEKEFSIELIVGL